MRPSNRTVLRNETFLQDLKICNADILIVTETNSIINPGTEYFSSSTRELPANFEDQVYAPGENRVTIFSKYPFGQDFETSDEYTSVCREILLPIGSLIIYATIIGVRGGKGRRFNEEFSTQKKDILQLSLRDNLCVAGDFNISFSGYPYPSHAIINEANEFFESIGMDIITRTNTDSPDHIAISRSFMKKISDYESSQQTYDKKITDHSLVTVSMHTGSAGIQSS